MSSRSYSVILSGRQDHDVQRVRQRAEVGAVVDGILRAVVETGAGEEVAALLVVAQDGHVPRPKLGVAVLCPFQLQFQRLCLVPFGAAGQKADRGHKRKADAKEKGGQSCCCRFHVDVH